MQVLDRLKMELSNQEYFTDSVINENLKVYLEIKSKNDSFGCHFFNNNFINDC